MEEQEKSFWQIIAENRRAKADEKRYGLKAKKSAAFDDCQQWLNDKRKKEKENKEDDDDETFLEKTWWSGGFLWGTYWMTIYWAFIVLWIVLAWRFFLYPSMVAKATDGGTEIMAAAIYYGVPMIMAYVYLYMWRKVHGMIKQPPPEDEEDIVYRLFFRMGIIKKTSRFDNWHVEYKGERKEQAYYYVVCREPGVNLFALQNTMREEAPKVRTPSGRTIYDVYIQPKTHNDTANFNMILDYRKQTDDEIIDWFGLKPELEPWSLPRNEDGKPLGVFAFGAIDKGMKYGEPYTAMIYQKHIGISGISGFGKSNMIHFLLWQLSSMDNAQIVYLDPQRSDGALWEERAIVIGGIDESLEALMTIETIMNERTNFMAGKMTNWNCTPRDPLIIVVVDEIKYLISKDKRVKEILANSGATARKAGICLMYATQYPKKEYVGGAWENLQYKVSSKTNDDVETAAVMGASFTQVAPCHKITTPGEFYIKSDTVEHLRVPLVPVDVVKEQAHATAKYRNNELAKRFGKGKLYTENKTDYNLNRDVFDYGINTQEETEESKRERYRNMFR